MLTVAGDISQSSYQNPAFESLRAKNRRQTVMTANAHVAMVIPRMLVVSDICSEGSKP